MVHSQRCGGGIEVAWMWGADGDVLAVYGQPAVRWTHGRVPPPCAVAAEMEALGGCGGRTETCSPFLTNLLCDSPTHTVRRPARAGGDGLAKVRMVLMVEGTFTSPTGSIPGHMLGIHPHSPLYAFKTAPSAKYARADSVRASSTLAPSSAF